MILVKSYLPVFKLIIVITLATYTCLLRPRIVFQDEVTSLMIDLLI
jgi:hypothetical protein